MKENIYLQRKLVCFCFVCNIGISKITAPICCALGNVGKPLMSIGAASWYHNILGYGEVNEH